MSGIENKQDFEYDTFIYDLANTIVPKIIECSESAGYFFGKDIMADTNKFVEVIKREIGLYSDMSGSLIFSSCGDTAYTELMIIAIWLKYFPFSFSKIYLCDLEFYNFDKMNIHVKHQEVLNSMFSFPPEVKINELSKMYDYMTSVNDIFGFPASSTLVLSVNGGGGTRIFGDYKVFDYRSVFHGISIGFNLRYFSMLHNFQIEGSKLPERANSDNMDAGIGKHYHSSTPFEHLNKDSLKY